LDEPPPHPVTSAAAATTAMSPSMRRIVTLRSRSISREHLGKT
jgi:hypothetical protein